MSTSSIIQLRKQYPQGTVIQLINMDDTQAPPSGTLGVVEHVDDAGTIHMCWQNGSGLGLIPNEDDFIVIKRPE